MDDVLVMGGGPAGSHVAGRLARSGHRVKVLEEHAEPGEAICCTGIVGRECLQRFPIAGATVLRAASSAVFFSPARKSLRLQKEVPQAYVLERSSLDWSLARQAETDGAEYVFGCHVENAFAVDGHVRVQSTCGGKDLVFQARSLVLASGFNPGLTARMGFGTVGDFAVAAQAEVETGNVEEVEIYFSQILAPGFFAWVVPTKSGMALAGLISRQRPGQYLRRFLSQLHAEGKISSPDVDIRYGKIPLRPLGRSYGRRMLVVGDAAGQVKPTTGGGIYYGLLCGDIAADVLDRALLCDDLSGKRLSEYERSWRKTLERELKMGYLSRLLFEKLSDSNIDDLFEVIEAYSLDKMALSVAGFSFDWHGDVLRSAIKHRAVREIMGTVLRGILVRQVHALRYTG